ncbi:MAG TPA: hypothetical protein VF470_00340 [Sphingomicrobium sp.]
MAVHPRKRRRRETISFTAECTGALGWVLTAATLFFVLLGFMKVSTVIWFLGGALLASFVSRTFDDDRVATMGSGALVDGRDEAIASDLVQTATGEVAASHTKISR